MPTLLDVLSERLNKYNLPENDLKNAAKYLERFGYAKGDSVSTDEVVKAVKSFQEYFDLDVDGELGPKTFRAMGYSRCGVPDIEFLDLEIRAGDKNWTYYIDGFVDGISKDEQRHIIGLAWKSWTDVADFSVREVDSKKASVIIGVGRGQRINFDGAGGTLAWATLSGRRDTQLQMMFDLDESWLGLNKQGRGIFFLNVAAHEIGHLISLTHSKVRAALMAAYYNAQVSKPQQNDDIPRAIKIYGAAKPGNPTNPVPPVNPTNPVKTVNIQLQYQGNLVDCKVDGFYTARL